MASQRSLLAAAVSLYGLTVLGAGAAPAQAPPDRWAGLWVGTASVNKVTQSLRSCEPEHCELPQPAWLGDDEDRENDNDCPNDGLCRLPCTASEISDATCADDPAGYRTGRSCRSRQMCAPAGEVVATGMPFDLRLIVHVDGDGQARLLKEVIQLFKQPSGSEAGRFVLLTDDSLIPDFDGVALRDGQPVGLRVSTVAYDFEEPSLPLGSFSDSAMLSAELAMPSAFPTNPYRHKFHPDHDGLDPSFASPSEEEEHEVVRTIELQLIPGFESIDFIDPLPEPPDWGSDVVGGIYTETVQGLHKEPITAAGPFILRRVAATPSLDDE